MEPGGSLPDIDPHSEPAELIPYLEFFKIYLNIIFPYTVR
jgi:hypothetical protein